MIDNTFMVNIAKRVRDKLDQIPPTTAVQFVDSVIDLLIAETCAEIGRPEIIAFARLMEQVLIPQEAVHGNGFWKDARVEQLAADAAHKATELKDDANKFFHGMTGNGEVVCRRAANLANYALMCADATGALK